MAISRAAKLFSLINVSRGVASGLTVPHWSESEISKEDRQSLIALYAGIETVSLNPVSASVLKSIKYYYRQRRKP